MNVLFVQEKPFLATALKLTLLTKGFDIIFSNDTQHPLSVIDHVHPAVIIADISKGQGIGYVEEGKKKNVPVIVISDNSSEDLQLAFDKGADDYVCTPVSLSELALRISLLARQRA